MTCTSSRGAARMRGWCAVASCALPTLPHTRDIIDRPRAIRRFCTQACLSLSYTYLLSLSWHCHTYKCEYIITRPVHLYNSIILYNFLIQCRLRTWLYNIHTHTCAVPRFCTTSYISYFNELVCFWERFCRTIFAIIYNKT